MAILAPKTTITTNNNMSQEDISINNNNINEDEKQEEDGDDGEMVMPGFRFHPTEEELIEFYLRRKVEGKRFNVQLITFLDLYRYDPWELPALAAIGEKEWFFYVPRDRKYRNGDRPNRVTTSGYWKATGADRMIRSETTSRAIGLKKTLVFYSGKAPKGIRTSWIMNEYRLPHHETERLQKAEISLCKVYKRPGVEDHPSVPRTISSSRASSSSSRNTSNTNSQSHKKLQIDHHHYPQMGRSMPSNYGSSSQSQVQLVEEKMNTETSGSSTTDHHQQQQHVGTSLGIYNNILINPMPPIMLSNNHLASINENQPRVFLQQQSYDNSSVDDDLHRLVSFQQQQQASMNNLQQQQSAYQDDIQFSNLQLSTSSSLLSQQPLSLSIFPSSIQQASTTFPERLWDWTSLTDGSKDFSGGPFK
ncbi:hypothetical protein LIER_00639 [Lithospermum erythrorhizon]|uniref:NAC domain-containing protein n=1 Tax=Lithospermum erythrorhizon TaxID=34254 RepID=A0AAV3NJC6_LITER